MPIRTAVAVISLLDDAARRETFTGNAAGAGLDWRFFDASRGLAPELRYDPEDSLIAFGRTLNAGELGCYSSHLRVWEHFLSTDLEQMVVLEDDVLVDWTFMRLLAEIDFAAQRVDYLRLFSRVLAPSKGLKWRYIEKSRQLLRFLDYVWGTQAYLVTRRGAARFLQHCRRITRPIDWEMDRFWAHGVPNLAVFPYPVIEMSAPSRIGDDRFSNPPVPAQLRARHVGTNLAEKGLRTLARVSPNPRLSL